MNYEGLLSPSETMKLLIKIEHLPKKKLGQNFLVDANIVRKSLELAELKEGENVVEVGPGLGTLTGAMLKVGAKVFAVELDKNLHQFLSETYKADKNFSLINADAIDLPLAMLPENELNFKIIANLPYAISTPWLDKVLSQKNLPQMMSLMLQKEAAERFIAKENSRDFAPISIFLGSAYEVKPMHKVSAACFYPKPNVDSALLPLKLKSAPYIFSPAVKNLIRKIFLTRRKQIGSIVKNLDADASKLLNIWFDENSQHGLDKTFRPENISLAFWRTLNEIYLRIQNF